jgi:hypothetical protein
LAAANSINDAGQIVGFGLLNGAVHGFPLTPTEQDVRGDTSAAQRAQLPKSIREWLKVQKSGLDRTRLNRSYAY